MVETIMFQALCQCFTYVISKSYNKPEKHLRLRWLLSITEAVRGTAQTSIQSYLASKDSSKVSVHKYQNRKSICCIGDYCLFHVNDQKRWTEVEGIGRMPLLCEGSAPGLPPPGSTDCPAWLDFSYWTSTVLSFFI